MWGRGKVVWSPVEEEYLRTHRVDTSVDQLAIALAKSRNAIRRKLDEFDGKISLTKLSRKSYIGKRKDLDCFMRSNWEANVARYLTLEGTKWEYEPEVFVFTDIKHGTVSYCLLPGTRVLTENQYSNIEDIQIGEKVVCPTSGRTDYVSATISHSLSNEYIYSLKTKFDVSPTIKLTGDHPLLAYKSKCNNKKCKLVYHRPDRCNLEIKEIKWFPFKELSKGDYIAIPLGGYDTLPIFSSDIAWIAGLYLAEGSKRNCDSIHITLNAKTEQDLALKIMNLAAKWGYRSRKEDHGSTIQVIISNHFYKVIEQFILGTDSLTKRLTTDFMNMPSSYQKELLAGYCLGDGNRKNNMQRISTSSEVLAHQIFLLAARQGFIPSKTWGRKKREAIIKGRKVQCNQEFEVKWFVTQKESVALIHNNHLMIPISSIEKELYTGLVYNLEVENEHCYFINSLPSHNCPDFRTGRYYIEVKGFLDKRGQTAIRRFKKYYPDQFKKLRAIVGSQNTKAAKFFTELEVPIIAYYSDLKRKYKDKIPNWEG